MGTLTPLLIADLFGLRQFGSIIGLTRLPIIIPVIVGPIMAGLIFDAMGSYNLVFLITIGLLIASLEAFLLTKVPPKAVLPLPSHK
ncbi:MAG: hypothetical protein KF753_16815 [Caldilineaceae bacterium]|nr:hypothetical protein [Caldilineaceae bacterium]